MALSCRCFGCVVQKVYRWIFPVVSYEWCIVGNTIGRHSWAVEKRKCKNGEPVGAGYFLTFIKCPDEATAMKWLVEFQEAAAEHNRKRYDR